MINLSLYEFDENVRKMGFSKIAGVDEAGRGPLAGPVVAAAVILRESSYMPEVNDSKKLSESKRERLLPQILANSLAASIGIASNEEIDELNILRASLLAMQRAISSLEVMPDICLVDGRDTPQGLPSPAVPLIKGDSRSLAIACASILAKVSRDEIMDTCDAEFPQYFFKKHKGYPTKLHYEMLEKYGPCRIHRLSFKGVVSK